MRKRVLKVGLRFAKLVGWRWLRNRMTYELTRLNSR